MSMVGRGSRLLLLTLVAATTTSAAPTPAPEPAVPFGHVIYRAARAGAFESLGVTMIACRHRDPVPRRFTVQFFDRSGRPISSFGPPAPVIPAGKKVVFVTDGMHFQNAPVVNLILGHLSLGTARVVSDAEIVHCIGKIRMDSGERSPSYRDEIGLVRAGAPLPELPDVWRALSRPSPRH